MPTQVSDALDRSAPFVAGFLGAVAVVVQLAGGPEVVAVPAWWAGAGLVLHLQVAALRAASGGTGLAGGLRVLPARCLLVVAAVAGAVSASPQSSSATLWAAALVLLAATLLEPLVAQLVPHEDVVGLPGVGPVPGVRPARAEPVLAVLVLWVASLLALIVQDGAPAVVTTGWVVAGLVCAALVAAAGFAAARGRRARRARTEQVVRALTRYAPTFALYTGRDDGGLHQLQMWLPYLRQLGEPFIVVTRSVRAQRALGGALDVPVYVAAGWKDLDPVVVPTLRAAFYVSAAATNTNFVGYRQLAHVYLGHGESDKASSFQPSHAMYDRVFVAGPAAVERYAAQGVPMRPDAFVVVGRPQADALTSVDAAAASTTSTPTAPRTALYAPTWSGYSADAAHSSLPLGAAVVAGLLSAGLRVVFRPHPFSLQRPGELELVRRVDDVLAAAERATGVRHLRSEHGLDLSLAGCMNESDLMVCDVSSVLVDYLATGKPFAVVSVGASPDELVRRHPSTSAAYVVPADLSGMAQTLQQMLGEDPRRHDRRVAMDQYLGGLDGPAAVAAFLAAARRCIDAGGAVRQAGQPEPTH
jgi:hypothetical protein